MSHTQGKLRVGSCHRLYTKDGRELAVVTKADPKLRSACDANASRLAHCWNQHDELVAQRDALMDACRAAESLAALAIESLPINHAVVKQAIVARDAARAAIAKAGGAA